MHSCIYTILFEETKSSDNAQNLKQRDIVSVFKMSNLKSGRNDIIHKKKILFK